MRASCSRPSPIFLTLAASSLNAQQLSESTDNSAGATFQGLLFQVLLKQGD
ncbi:MAG: hypothetical protein QNJ68_02750 [Microcoleaceae cyanobacterium MO_207.B10]|nr:hypothetical protein [Microcoleaceae cyanobacterium MO_207.B10]